MKIAIPILLLTLTVFTSCKKNCWHCTTIKGEEYLYTKGTDSIKVIYIEWSYPIVNDSLRELGYTATSIGFTDIPIDYTYCDGAKKFGLFYNCNRVK